jgi:septal ring factor EnvC (AmiA/AmiB activator)
MTGRPTKWMVLLAAAGSVAAAGCGSTNPPCPVAVAEVEEARTAAASVEERLATLRQEKAQLEKRIAAEEGRRAELEGRKAQIEAEIAELGG